MHNTVQDGGRLCMDEASVRRDTTIESGGVEFFENLSNSGYAII
ncbi:hypothetical protein [Bartonella florencae]|nr:hypothetical protein [Bartonella florencae]